MVVMYTNYCNLCVQ